MLPKYYLYALIAIISLSSIYGFNNPAYVQKMIFSEKQIQQFKEYYRMLSSSFVHSNYMHLIFNMFVLWQFGEVILGGFSVGMMMLIYFAAVLGGSIYSYYMHLNEWNYYALGASGGVTGILMSYIVVAPDQMLGLFFIPIPIPGYVLIFLYLCYEVYAMIKIHDKVGHDAHIGGAIIGLLITVIHVGRLPQDVIWKIALVSLPLLVAIVYSVITIKAKKE